MSKRNRVKRNFNIEPPTRLESVKGTWVEAVVKDTPPEFQNTRPIPPHVIRGFIPESDIDTSRLQPDGSPNMLTAGGKPMTKDHILNNIRTVDDAMKRQGYSYAQRAFVQQQAMAWMLYHTSLISQREMILDAFHESGTIDAKKTMRD